MKKMGKTKTLQNTIRYFLAIILVLTVVLFSVLTKSFLSVGNVMDILRSAGVLSVMALGMTICLTMGDMNFALGAQITITAAVIGNIMNMSQAWWAYPAALVAGIGASVLIGALTALIVVSFNVPAFIGTLALQMILTGIGRVLTGNTVMYSAKWSEAYTFIGQTKLFGVVPLAVLLCAAICICVWIYMAKTRSGRNLFALGANPIASKQMGVNIAKEKYKAYLICGLLVGIAAALQTSVNKNASVSMGSEMLLPAISTTMLGATFLTPGKYNTWGTVVAAIFLYVIQYGVISMGLQFNMREVVQGIILVIAVGAIALIREDGLPQVKFE